MSDPYNGRFQPHAKSRRYDKSVLTGLDSEDGLKRKGFKVERLGAFLMPSRGNAETPMVAVIVTFPNGLEVPAYRRAASDSFVVCQNYAFVMQFVRTQPEKKNVHETSQV